MSRPPHFDQAGVDQLLAEAWAIPRDPRSNAYKAGLRAYVENRLLARHFQCPFPKGTSEADAWDAGTWEGRWLLGEAMKTEAA